MKLYEIPDAYRYIDAMLDESGGEITEEIEACMAEAEASLAGAIDSYASLIDERIAQDEADRATAAAIEATAKAWRDRARVSANAAERYKARLMRGLDALGLDAAKGLRRSARIQRNGQPAVTWEGEGEPPEGFRRVTVEPDKAAALEAYRSGRSPEGFRFAFGRHLRLR